MSIIFWVLIAIVASVLLVALVLAILTFASFTSTNIAPALPLVFLRKRIFFGRQEVL